MQDYIKEQYKNLLNKFEDLKKHNIYVNKIYIVINSIYNQHKKLTIILLCLAIIFFVTHGVKSLFTSKHHSLVPLMIKANPVIKKDAQLNIGASGVVQPSAIIEIKAQTSGTIVSTDFNKGQLVQKGQLLFEIDDSLQKASYNQATANLEKSKANLKNAELDLQKNNELYDKNFISDQEYQQIVTKHEIAKASFAESEAALEAATIELGYTKIYSPIAGIAGEILLDPGNNIRAGLETLVNIHQVNPINVLFNVSEAHLQDLMKYINNLDSFEVFLVNGDKDSNRGKLIFVNNTVDHLNGTISLKAEFCNNSLYLWPGQFVNVEFVIKKLVDALVVPSRAVQSGQQGTYVYVAEKKKKSKKHFAKVRKVLVQVGSILKEETVIVGGLNKGDLVVTEGHGHLVDNSIVELYEY